MNKLFFFIAICSVTISCSLFDSKDSENESKVIARVYDKKLYQKDLEQLFPKNMSKEDSIVVARDFINSWAKQALLLKKAVLNLPEQNEDLEKLVAKYRQDLFINSFKDALIKQKLDTVITNLQIEEYYKNNKESFRINENLIRFKYVKITKKNKDKSRFKKLLISKGRNDLQLLDESKDAFLASFLADTVWVRYSNVKNSIPVLNSAESLTKEQLYEHTIGDTVYYIYINDLKRKNDIAPVRYMAPTIRKMLLHKRKLDLVTTVEEVLVDDAKKDKQFEIY